MKLLDLLWPKTFEENVDKGRINMNMLIPRKDKLLGTANEKNKTAKELVNINFSHYFKSCFNTCFTTASNV